MFNNQPDSAIKSYRFAVVGLSLLSAAALAITIWVMADFLREQETVKELTKNLPVEARGPARELASELLWQFRLTTLVVLNVVVTGIAVVLLWRAYRTSQASLRDLRALASDVLSCMEQGVVTTDQHGTITSINRRGLELLETDADCRGQPIHFFELLPIGEFYDDWSGQNNPSMSRDLRITHQGNQRTLHTSCQHLTNHEGIRIGNVLQISDITDQALVEDRIRRMERYMGLGSLAGGLHHEIKNPLAALSLHAQLLGEHLRAGRIADAATPMLSVIQAEIKRIGAVLEGFRDFASIAKLDTCELDIAEVVRQQLDRITPQAAASHIKVESELPTERLIVLADRLRLEQVLLNLLVNAIEAMPDGGQLRAAVKLKANSLVIEVTDSGGGIPGSLKEKVFDPYFTTKGTGTGLGLAICDKIVRQHGGSLEFQTSSQGTTFRLLLPYDAESKSKRREESING